MTTLEDLYGYYCRRCDCKPNTALSAQLRDAFAKAEAQREALEKRLIGAAIADVNTNGTKQQGTTSKENNKNKSSIGLIGVGPAAKLITAQAADDVGADDGADSTAAAANREMLLNPSYSRNNNPNITEIDLSSNYVGPKGLEPILLLVKNLYNVKTLRLCHNMLQHDSIVLLCEHFAEDKHPSLSTIDLRSNLLYNGPTVAQLIRLVESNPRIETILLDGNEGLTHVEKQRIEQYLEMNRARRRAEEETSSQLDAIAKQARDARRGQLHLPHKAQLAGLKLTRQVSGGHFHYASWRRNPQFIFRVSHRSVVGFTLRIEEPIVSTRQYGFAIVKTARNSSFGSVLRVVDVVSKEQLLEDEKKKKSLQKNDDAYDASCSLDRNVIIAESPFHERRAYVEVTLDACVDDVPFSDSSARRSGLSAAPSSSTTSPYVVIVYSFGPDKECPTSYSIDAEIISAVSNGGAKRDVAADASVGASSSSTFSTSVIDEERAFVRLEPIEDTYDWSQVTMEGAWRGDSTANVASIQPASALANEVKANETGMGPLPYASWRENDSFRVRIVSQQEEEEQHEQRQQRNGGRDGSSASLNDATLLIEEIEAASRALTKEEASHHHHHQKGGGGASSSSTTKKRAVNKSAATAAIQKGEAIARAIQASSNNSKTNATLLPSSSFSLQQHPSPSRLAKSLLSGLATVYIVLTKNNDSDVNDSHSIGFCVVTSDRKGRLPMRIVSDDSGNKAALGIEGGGCGGVTFPPKPALSTDGALVALCPHHRRTSVTLAIEVPINEMDFFVIPTTSKPIENANFGNNSKNNANNANTSTDVPFTIQFFSTCAIAVDRYAYNHGQVIPTVYSSSPSAAQHATATNASSTPIDPPPHSQADGRNHCYYQWQSEWSLHTKRLRFDPTSSSGGCRQDNKASWTHNHAMEFYNDGQSIETTAAGGGDAAKDDDDDATTSTTTAADHGIDLCVSVEATAAVYGGGSGGGEKELVEVAVMLVALRRCDTASETVLSREDENGGATVDNVNSLDTALVSATAAGKRSGISMQHQLVVIAHSPFTSASPVYGGSTPPPSASAKVDVDVVGAIPLSEVAAAKAFVALSASSSNEETPRIPNVSIPSSSSSSSFSSSPTAFVRFEATLAVTDLPRGRYFIVLCTRRGGQVGFDAIVRCYSSNSSYRKHSTTSNSSNGSITTPQQHQHKENAHQQIMTHCARFTDIVRPLGDWARDQQLIDFHEETNLRRSVASGAAPTTATATQLKLSRANSNVGTTNSTAANTSDAALVPSASKVNFVGVNVKDLLRQNKRHTDRDFPPMPSSLWMDTVNPYPNAPTMANAKAMGDDFTDTSSSSTRVVDDRRMELLDGLPIGSGGMGPGVGRAVAQQWLRASEIAMRQQEKYLANVVVPEEALSSSSSSSLNSKGILKDLELVMSRRKASLGLIHAISTGGGSHGNSTTNANSNSGNSADALSDVFTQSVRASFNINQEMQSGHNSAAAGPTLLSGFASFLASNLYTNYSHRVLSPHYSGCVHEHTHLGSEWFLSALACVLTRPTTFAARMIGGYNADGGVAQFRFFLNGSWQTIVVDDYLAVDGSGEPCFTTSITDGDFLAPLVEKAYAKAHRCYAALGSERGLVRKRLMGVLPAAETNGLEAMGSGDGREDDGEVMISNNAGGGDDETVTIEKRQLLAPKPPSTSSSSSKGGAMVLADQGVTLHQNTAGANFRRTVLARSYHQNNNNNKPANARVTELSDVVMLTTDAATSGKSTVLSSQRIPTAPVLSYDSAAYGVDIEAAHDRSNNKKQSASNKNISSPSSSASSPLPSSSPMYAASGVNAITNVRYGEPPIAMLQQSLTDFTGGIVRCYDISSSIPNSSGAVSGRGTTAIVTMNSNKEASPSSSVAPPHSPSHVSNNATDSAAYFTNNMLPPHMSETISASIYLNEDRVMNRRDLVWRKILENVFDPERIIAAGMMMGSQGWEQRRHSGINYNALYPIIDAREVDGVRLVKVFNNWGAPNIVVGAKGKSADRERHHNTLWWKGKFGWGSSSSSAPSASDPTASEPSSSSEGWTERLKSAVGYDISHSKTTFWMSISEVVYYFSHLFEVHYDVTAVAASTAMPTPSSHSSASVTPSPSGTGVWVEGGYSATHQGGSLASTSWINNDQYALTIVNAAEGGGGGGNDASSSFVEVTVGVHQPNERAKMTRARDARYAYGQKPIGLCIIRTRDDSRRLATLTRDDHVTTLYPAAVRDRYHTFKIPRSLLHKDGAIAGGGSGRGDDNNNNSAIACDKFILMPFVSVAGANDDEVRWAAAHAMPIDDSSASAEATSPFSLKHAVTYYLSVSSRDVPCGIRKIGDDSRSMVEGEWRSAASSSDGSGVSTAGGPPSFSSWRNNPQFLLYPSFDGEVTITLKQRNKLHDTSAHIGFVVVDATASHLTRLLHLEGYTYNGKMGGGRGGGEEEGGGSHGEVEGNPSAASVMQTIPNKVILSVPHTNDHAVVGQVKLLGMQTRRGKPYHIVPSCSEPDLPTPTGFTIEITCSNNNSVRIVEIPPERDWKAFTISESFKLTGGNTGGSTCYSTWRNNPQYLLKLPYEQTSRLLISIRNKNRSDPEKLGVVLFACDKWGSNNTNDGDASNTANRTLQSVRGGNASSSSSCYYSQMRKLLLNNAAAKPIVPQLVKKNKNKSVEEEDEEAVAGPHTAALLGPSFEDYTLVNGPTDVDTFESNRDAFTRVDALVDTTAYAHHAEVFYDASLASADEGIIVMPYTDTPMTEMDVEITILSTAPIELSPITTAAANASPTSSSAALASMKAFTSPLAPTPSPPSSAASAASAPLLRRVSPFLPGGVGAGAVLDYHVALAEGSWEAGVTAGGARALGNSWINNPFFALSLFPTAAPVEKRGGYSSSSSSAASASASSLSLGTRLFIVMLTYPKGPEKPVMRKVGKGGRVVVPPTTRTVPSLSTMLALTTAAAGNGQQKEEAQRQQRQGSGAFRTNHQQQQQQLRDANALIHNSHKSVAARTLFGFDIVRGDALNTPLCSSRHTNEGETAVLIESLLPCEETQLPYYIVPHAREQGVEGYFKLLVFSDKPVQLSEFKKPKRFW